MAKVHKSVGFGSAERCNDDDDEKSRIGHSENSRRDPSSPRSVGMTHISAMSSTSLSVLQYLAVNTRVLGLKYCSTCKEVLIVT